jgi:hypothetical protein
MMNFRDTLTYCDVHDIGFSGMPWTYDNKQRGDRNVRVLLDRAVASTSWSNWFPEARLQHLVSSHSDHLPIFLDLDRDMNRGQSKRLFQYEIMWEREPSLPGAIGDA